MEKRYGNVQFEVDIGYGNEVFVIFGITLSN